MGLVLYIRRNVGPFGCTVFSLVLANDYKRAIESFIILHKLSVKTELSFRQPGYHYISCGPHSQSTSFEDAISR